MYSINVTLFSAMQTQFENHCIEQLKQCNLMYMEKSLFLISISPYCTAFSAASLV